MNKLLIVMLLQISTSLVLAKNKNPLVGKWIFSKVENCIETYEFLDNGKMISRSKKEINERAYSLKAISKNIFSVSVTTISTNNLESCSGIVNNSYIGVGFQLIFELNDNKNEFYIYFETDEPDKLGPFIKI